MDKKLLAVGIIFLLVGLAFIGASTKPELAGEIAKDITKKVKETTQ